MPREFIRVKITREIEPEGDNKYPRSRTLLEQELELESFELGTVIEAVNFPELFKATADKAEMQALINRCASSPRQPTLKVVDPEQPEEFSLEDATKRVAAVLRQMQPGSMGFYQLAELIIEAVFSKRS